MGNEESKSKVRETWGDKIVEFGITIQHAGALVPFLPS
jgi:hypothetical protein